MKKEEYIEKLLQEIDLALLQESEARRKTRSAFMKLWKALLNEKITN